MVLDGVEGVDNQLVILIFVFDVVGLGVVEEFVQGVIEDGGFLIVWQIEGIDDFMNDDEVQFIFCLGLGILFLGIDGLLLSGQIFYVYKDDFKLVVLKVWIVDGVVYLDLFDLVLLIWVFDQYYVLQVKNGWI